MVKTLQLKEKMIYNLELYKEQENRLKSLLKRRSGSIVSSSDWPKLTEQFEYIHKKDAELNSLVDIYKHEKLLPEVQNLAVELRDCIMRVKQDMDLVYLRISGEQKLVSNRLKKVVKGLNIGGYKSGFNFRRGPEKPARRTNEKLVRKA